MRDATLDQAIVDHKTYGTLDRQHALFSTLRKEDPVHWTEPAGFRPFWTISKHQDIIEIERQNERFINAPPTAGRFAFTWAVACFSETMKADPR